jgi:hypothetical protein
MNTVSMNSPSTATKWGWLIFLVINALLVLNSVILFFFIATETGEQSSAILLAGLGITGLLFAQEGYRMGSRQAWKSSWIIFGVLLALGINISAVGEFAVGVFYLFLSGVTLLGLVLARNG